MEEIVCKLKLIEICNFKSFEGLHRFGPLKDFSSIIGPNGSGKSNFMDAVSFVLGENAQSLRVDRLGELIHGASRENPSKGSATVKATFLIGDDVEKSFSRKVKHNSSVYHIDGKEVQRTDYRHQLEKMGINVKGKNFLVFQGTVESIAMMNPKERAALFEEMSGSGVYKEEYNQLKATMVEAQSKIQFLLQRKKVILEERKQARGEKDLAEEYERLLKDLKDKKRILYLFKLYRCEEHINTGEEEIKNKDYQLKQAERRKDELERDLQGRKKEHAAIVQQIDVVDADIRKIESEITKMKPDQIKADERVTHLKKNSENTKKLLVKARKSSETHALEVAQLEKALADIEMEKVRTEETFQRENQEAGLDLTVQQLDEYERLKDQVAQQSFIFLQELDALNREQKADQGKLDNKARVRSELRTKWELCNRELGEKATRIEQLDHNISQTKEDLEEQRLLLVTTTREVELSKEKAKELKEQLTKTVEDLSEIQLSRHEDSRSQKKREVLQKLQSRYKGVYGRIVHLCQARHARHQMAVAKVLGKYMDAIVVDSEITTQTCIEYLREQRLEPETFLPLNSLKAKPVKERLRNPAFQQEYKFKVLYDLISYNSPEIEKAILYVTNNTLVCNNMEDARRAAYEMPGGERYDTVAYDGTHFQKSGLISGGSRDLARKVARWNESTLKNLQARKEKLIQDVRQAEEQFKKESELPAIRHRVAGLEARLRYATLDKGRAQEEFKTIQARMDDFRRQLELVDPEEEATKSAIEERKARIRNLEEQMVGIRDQVYEAFCAQLGVPTISYFEAHSLKARQEQTKKIEEFESHMSRVRKQLEFEGDRGRQMATNIERWQRCVKKDQEDLAKAEELLAEVNDKLKNGNEELAKVQESRKAKENELNSASEEIAKTRNQLSKAARQIQDCRKAIGIIEVALNGKKAERHMVLKQAKMADVEIPMTKGDMNDIEENDENVSQNADSESSSAPSSQTIYERESRLIVDYDELNDEYKNVMDKDDERNKEKALETLVREADFELKRTPSPNLKADDRLQTNLEKLKEVQTEFDEARKEAQKATEAFSVVRNKRLGLFNDFFEHAAKEIDGIYKALTKRTSASAALTASDPDEPFYGSINYCCIIPGKPCRPMSGLSGGEKTLASLALLFACRSYKPAPFFVLDEIDAALDETNVYKVSDFIRSHLESAKMQAIVISHKKHFFSRSNALIGFFSRAVENQCAKTKKSQLDLTEYLMYQDREVPMRH